MSRSMPTQTDLPEEAPGFGERRDITSALEPRVTPLLAILVSALVALALVIGILVAWFAAQSGPTGRDLQALVAGRLVGVDSPRVLDPSPLPSPRERGASARGGSDDL